MKVKAPKHMSGKVCGYELMPDGDIVLAPAYSEQYKKLDEERAGVELLLEAVNKHCSTMLTAISRRRRILWESIADDYDLDKKAEWQISDCTTLRKMPKEKVKE